MITLFPCPSRKPKTGYDPAKSPQEHHQHDGPSTIEYGVPRTRVSPELACPPNSCPELVCPPNSRQQLSIVSPELAEIDAVSERAVSPSPASLHRCFVGRLPTTTDILSIRARKKGELGLVIVISLILAFCYRTPRPGQGADFPQVPVDTLAMTTQ